MGPTLFLPGTHTAAAHDEFDDDDLGYLDARSAAASVHQACLDVGDASVYDSRLLHAGGGYPLPAPTVAPMPPRALLYVTFRHPDADAMALGNEEAHSLRPELRGSFTLGDLRQGPPSPLVASGR